MSGMEFSPNQRLAIYAMIGLCAAVLSYAHLSKSLAPASNQIEFREPDNTGVSQSRGKVVCHVVGCVKRPGVYTLEAGKRVIDAINAAGGPKPEADVNAINLAQKVDDGSRIDVPALVEARSTSPSIGNLPVTASVSGGLRSTSKESQHGKLVAPGQGTVHINSASLEELQRLPGVGPATAEKILEYRRTVGRFTQPEQIMDVNGIGPKKYEKMRPFLAL